MKFDIGVSSVSDGLGFGIAKVSDRLGKDLGSAIEDSSLMVSLLLPQGCSLKFS